MFTGRRNPASIGHFRDSLLVAAHNAFFRERDEPSLSINELILNAARDFEVDGLARTDVIVCFNWFTAVSQSDVLSFDTAPVRFAVVD